MEPSGSNLNQGWPGSRAEALARKTKSRPIIEGKAATEPDQKIVN